MTTQTVNLDTYSLSLLTAKEDILNPRSSTNWALFMYDGVSNKLKLADSGAGGVAELAGKLQISKPQYGLCSVGSVASGGPQIAMVIWVGQDVDEYRRTECASHVPAIKSFFKEVNVFISAEKADDVTEERVGAELIKVQARAPTERIRRSSKSVEKEETVGTNYRKTNAALEMRKINRDSFWARAEREEEERKEQERRRAIEEQRRLEKERILKERREAEERDRKMNEKLQMIEEQRRKQAEQDEELRRREKSRWELEQREHEEDMRARLRRSESIEKAAEAAALVSQRSMNPREFFRQLSSSSLSPVSPGSPRTVKAPFRRYQRSLTDTAFIFSRPDDSAAISPRSPPLTSPFSRNPTSPILRATSPPASASFCPIASPPRRRAPLLSPAPVSASALASQPETSPHVQDPIVRPRTPSPTPPSAPPASPSHLASAVPSFPQSQPDGALPPSPPMTPPQLEQDSMAFEASQLPQVPTAPLPESPLNTADMHTELVSAKNYIAQAVLVEEDEADVVEENEGGKLQPEAQAEPGPEPEPILATTEYIQVIEEKEEEDTEQLVEPVQEEEEDAENDGLENDQSVFSWAAVEPVTAQLSEEEEESTVKDANAICQHIKQETVVVTTNGITNTEGIQKLNGIERSLSPSDTELSSPELVVCYSLHSTAEEDYVAGDEDQEISENGEEDVPERQMCVRALYDYQAEDESEISFEPGDIISDVETVDKAWWRGYSKDGRQGLFPANYVETI